MGFSFTCVLILKFSSVPATEVPISVPQASLSVAINVFGASRLPVKEDLPQTHLFPFLAAMPSEEDHVVSWCFAQTLGECPSGRHSAQGHHFGRHPTEFHFHFFIEKSKSRKLEPIHIDFSGASENYILCRTEQVPR